MAFGYGILKCICMPLIQLGIFLLKILFSIASLIRSSLSRLCYIHLQFLSCHFCKVSKWFCLYCVSYVTVHCEMWGRWNGVLSIHVVKWCRSTLSNYPSHLLVFVFVLFWLFFCFYFCNIFSGSPSFFLAVTDNWSSGFHFKKEALCFVCHHFHLFPVLCCFTVFPSCRATSNFVSG